MEDKYKTRRGKNHFAWKGDEVGNISLHKWLYRTLGKAVKCEQCGVDKIPKGKKYWFEWSNKTGKNTRKLENWWQLCIKCHRKYDNWNKKLLGSFLKSRCWENKQRNNQGQFI